MDTMKAKTVNSVRRQVLIAGVSIAAIPALTALPAWAVHTATSKLNDEKKLVLSGRLTEMNGYAISGAVVELEHQKVSTLTDADGRFLLVSSLPADHDVTMLIAARTGEQSKKFVAKASYKNLASNGVLRSSISLKI
jgi:hypothetical protein